jgi:hypothetical protein
VGVDGLSDVSPVVLVAKVVGGVLKHGGEGGWSLTKMSLPCFVCPDSSIKNEAKCERAAGVPTWFGFPHHGNNWSMVVRILVLL